MTVGGEMGIIESSIYWYLYVNECQISECRTGISRRCRSVEERKQEEGNGDIDSLNGLVFEVEVGTKEGQGVNRRMLLVSLASKLMLIIAASFQSPFLDRALLPK